MVLEMESCFGRWVEWPEAICKHWNTVLYSLDGTFRYPRKLFCLVFLPHFLYISGGSDSSRWSMFNTQNKICLILEMVMQNDPERGILFIECCLQYLLWSPVLSAASIPVFTGKIGLQDPRPKTSGKIWSEDWPAWWIKNSLGYVNKLNILKCRGS